MLDMLDGGDDSDNSNKRDDYDKPSGVLMIVTAMKWFHELMGSFQEEMKGLGIQVVLVVPFLLSRFLERLRSMKMRKISVKNGEI